MKLSIITFFCLLFSNLALALSVTPSPSALSCGTTTSVTFTFDCAFNGTRIVVLPTGVSFPNLGAPPYLITVTNGIATVDVLANQSASSPFNITFGPVSQDLPCAQGQSASANFTLTCTVAENDDCVDAVPLDISQGSCSYISFITDNSSYSGTNAPCGPAGYNDLWYTFVANNSTVTMEWNQLPGSFGYYALRTDCPNNGGTLESCSIMINGQSSTIDFDNLTVGNEYSLQMSFLSSEAGNDQELCLHSATVPAALNAICPSNISIGSCLSQSSVNSQFNNWLADFEYENGCTVTESGNTGSAPSNCGGSTTINYSVTDDCGGSSSCSATFTVANAPSLSISCPTNMTASSCLNQSAINTQFSTWLNDFNYSGGCTVTESGNSVSAPSSCGGNVTINYTASDNCGQSESCSRTFTVPSAPNLTVSCPTNMTLTTCNSQTFVNNQFSNWLNNFNYTGGCTVTESGNTGTAPSNCGGSTTINYTVTDNCGNSDNCSRTFAVSSSPALTVSCPTNMTLTTCNSQTFVNNQFSNWLNNFDYTGGCTVTETGNTGVAPSNCGGSTTINYTVTDNCGNNDDCSRTFAVSAAPAIVINCPSDISINSCNSQSSIDSQFGSWLSDFSFVGGCNPLESGLNVNAPPACGGSTTINYIVTDDCSQSSSCSVVFTVNAAPNLTVTCANNITLNSCDSQASIDAQFSSWLTGFSFSGGCNPSESGLNETAPSACGGSTSIFYSVTDDCSQSNSCSAVFSVSNAPNLVATCPTDMSIGCSIQSSIDAQFATWLMGFSYVGGCNATESGLNVTAPTGCGGVTVVNYSITDDCGQNDACTASFSVGSGIVCQDTIYISDIGPNTPNVSYESSMLISTNGSTLIQTDGIIFSAGQEVELNVGFDSGLHDFEAIIQGCIPN